MECWIEYCIITPIIQFQMGFDSRGKRRFRNHAGFFSSSVACLRSQSLDFTAVLPEIVRLIGNWGMAVRCWGTKRRQEDMTISPPDWACRYEIKASPPGRRLAHSNAFSPRHCQTTTNTQKKKNKHTFHLHTNIFALCLSAYLPTTQDVSLWVSLCKKKYCIYKTFQK